MARKLLVAVIALIVMMTVVGAMAVWETGCGVLDDFGNFGGKDSGGSATPKPKPTIGTWKNA